MTLCACGKEAIEDNNYCYSCWNKNYCKCPEKPTSLCEICMDRIVSDDNYWEEKVKGCIRVYYHDYGYDCGYDCETIFSSSFRESIIDDLIDPKKYPQIYVAFYPVKKLHFRIFNELRKAKRPWTDLNKATKITFPNPGFQLEQPPCPEDEYDESREYTPITIEFGEDKLRDMPKSFYMQDAVLYEYPTTPDEYQTVFPRHKTKTEYFLSTDKRWWGGIPFEGYHNNFCDSGIMTKYHDGSCSEITFSGEFG